MLVHHQGQSARLQEEPQGELLLIRVLQIRLLPRRLWCECILGKWPAFSVENLSGSDLQHLQIFLVNEFPEIRHLISTFRSNL